MRAIFARTTPENVEALFPAISKAWYALAGIEILWGLGLSGLAWWPVGSVSDSIFFVTEGYFFGRRKSRAVAIGMLAVVLSQIGLRIPVVGWGFVEVSDWTYLLAVALALRGAEVSVAYHRMRRTVINWPHVITISGVSIVAAFFMGMITLMVLLAGRVEMSSFASVAYLLVISGTFVLTMATLTWRLPFARM